jgi:hypothetical protein
VRARSAATVSSRPLVAAGLAATLAVPGRGSGWSPRRGPNELVVGRRGAPRSMRADRTSRWRNRTLAPIVRRSSAGACQIRSRCRLPTAGQARGRSALRPEEGLGVGRQCLRLLEVTQLELLAKRQRIGQPQSRFIWSGASASPSSMIARYFGSRAPASFARSRNSDRSQARASSVTECTRDVRQALDVRAGKNTHKETANRPQPTPLAIRTATNSRRKRDCPRAAVRDPGSAFRSGGSHPD